MSKKTYIITGMIIAITAFAFYWYELKPADIRKTCSNEALESAVSSTQNYANDNMIKRQEKQDELIDELYNNCIKSYGLEK